MPVQTSYSSTHAAAYVGGRADSRPMTCHPGRNNSGAELPYGRFMKHDLAAGTSELAIALPSASGSKLVGVLLHDAAHESQTTGLPDDAMGSVIARGAVNMITEQAVTPSDPVFVRFAMVTGSGTTPAVGQVRKDADTADAVAAPNCRFLTSAVAGGIVAVELNLP